ncbi:Mob1/phocein [Gorgonomyces haynaldii]|nr:Mob1/phocein [Gorgonomyces haynaldii]
MVVLYKNTKGIRSENWEYNTDKEGLEHRIRNAVYDGTVLDLLDNEPKDPQVQLEHMKSILSEFHDIFVLLTDECDKTSCPEMKAGDWIYHCAAHGDPTQCCAIDYCAHTLDQASVILTHKNMDDIQSGHLRLVKELQQIFRRMYRILAHAYFHHRDLYLEFETQRSLHARVVKMARHFELLSENTIIIKA